MRETRVNVSLCSSQVVPKVYCVGMSDEGQDVLQKSEGSSSVNYFRLRRKLEEVLLRDYVYLMYIYINYVFIQTYLHIYILYVYAK